MITLGFDTSAAHCSATLLRDGVILSTKHEEMTKGQAERLIPLLEEVLAEASLTWADLDRIGVGIGPGNFTGIRISIAAARGLALSLNIPAVGISVLDAAAFGTDGPVLACMAAPGKAAYIQLLGRGEIPDEPARLIRAEDDLSHLKHLSLTCIGSAAEIIAARVNGEIQTAKHATATAIARLAARADITNLTPPAPLYMRPADAAPSRDVPPVIVP
jgi:tRNA threonylcarbamoyl adenosine modification protein YeaZ